MVWTGSSREQWRAVVNTVMNPRVPENVQIFSNILSPTETACAEFLLTSNEALNSYISKGNIRVI
jgi:hypothetical protein